MIVTRSWLQEFIDLSDIDDNRLYKTLNSIGLEVDRMVPMVAPENVVVGRVLSCQKHPDADKLNVCEVDIGGGTLQIVCGAANVKDAEYVAVAQIGAVLPGGLIIKEATLRGVQSSGMICALDELGFAKAGEGIAILDESIGKLEVGKPLREYQLFNDTLIELELTANRGDCLSVFGVARELAAAFNKDLKKLTHKSSVEPKLGIAREASLHIEGDPCVDVSYKMCEIGTLRVPLKVALRIAQIEVEPSNTLETFLHYAIHATGVILRAYKVVPQEDGKTHVFLKKVDDGLMEVVMGERCSIIGAHQDTGCKPKADDLKLFFEASYIDPKKIVTAVAKHKIQTDALYYRTSRGSNDDLAFGQEYLLDTLQEACDMTCFNGSLEHHYDKELRHIRVDAKRISTIVGQEIEQREIAILLKRLGFEIKPKDDRFLVATVPSFRHDIENIQDIAEEILRFIGIDRIEGKALCFVEKPRMNATSRYYSFAKSLRERASAVGFYETLSYLFTSRALLEKFGFEVLDESLDLANPIASELDTLRTTLLIGLLQAASRNIKYSKRSVSLFEIGIVVDSKREECRKLAFVSTGADTFEDVTNSGKPPNVDFASFVKKIGSVVGEFTLENVQLNEAFLHPYQCALALKGGKKIGYIAKLHPLAAEAFDLQDTFVAEFALNDLMQERKTATQVSDYQGVYKDLSVVIDDGVTYAALKKALDSLAHPLIRNFYPIDLYKDESLGNKKSITIRFFLQSPSQTLSDLMIEEAMQSALAALQEHTGAVLR